MCLGETWSLGLLGAKRSRNRRAPGLAEQRGDREVLPGSRVWVLLQGFIRGRMLRAPPKNAARRGVGDSSAELMDLHNNNWTLSVLGSGWRGREPALGSKHLRNCVVRPLRGRGRRWVLGVLPVNKLFWHKSGSPLTPRTGRISCSSLASYSGLDYSSANAPKEWGCVSGRCGWIEGVKMPCKKPAMDGACGEALAASRPAAPLPAGSSVPRSFRTAASPCPRSAARRPGRWSKRCSGATASE